MSEKLDRLRAEIEAAEKQKEILANREQRLKNRERYYRKASDRKRTHRLIQYKINRYDPVPLPAYLFPACGA